MVDLWGQDHGLREVHQEDLGEACPETGTIDVNLACLRQIDFLAPRTEVLEPACFQLVTQADWENFLAVTEGSRARAINSIKVLLINFCKAASCQYKTRMNDTVQVRGLLVELKEAFILQVFFIRLLLGENHAQARLHLVLGKLVLQPLQIEGVHDELVVDLDQELVPLQLAEPLDPPVLLVGQCRVIREAINLVVVLVRLAVVLVLHAGHPSIGSGWVVLHLPCHVVRSFVKTVPVH